MKTWVLEAGLAALVLGAVAGFTGNDVVAWLTAIAVLLTFCHMQVSARLGEAEEDRIRQGYSTVAAVEHRVECYRMLVFYLVAKEACWIAVFYLLRSWPALVGVPLFLLYPLWRKYWVSRRTTRRSWSMRSRVRQEPTYDTASFASDRPVQPITVFQGVRPRDPATDRLVVTPDQINRAFDDARQVNQPGSRSFGSDAGRAGPPWPADSGDCTHCYGTGEDQVIGSAPCTHCAGTGMHVPLNPTDKDLELARRRRREATA